MKRARKEKAAAKMELKSIPFQILTHTFVNHAASSINVFLIVHEFLPCLINIYGAIRVCNKKPS